MKKFFNGEIALGVAAGFLATFLVFSVVSYQTEHCRKIESSERASPNPEKKPPLAGGEDAEREKEISEYAESHPGVCGVGGFPTMLVGFMDHHEGFFVSAFTFALFLVTFFLCRSTDKLWEAGERQIAQTIRSVDSLVASENSFIVERIEKNNIVGLFRAGSSFPNSPSLGDSSIMIEIDYSFKNYGKTPGTILAFFATFSMDAQHPPIDPDNFTKDIGSAERLDEYTLAANENTKTITIKIPFRFSWAESNELVRQQKSVWVIGHVIWEDVFARENKRVFVWKYDRRVSGFRPYKIYKSLGYRSDEREA